MPSTQIKKLEAFLGGILFERTNTALFVTPISERLVGRARTVIVAAETIVGLARARAAPRLERRATSMHSLFT